MLNKGCNMSLGIEWCLQSELSALCDVFVCDATKEKNGRGNLYWTVRCV